MDSFNSKKRAPDEFISSSNDFKKNLPESKNPDEKIDANQVISIRLVSEPADLLEANHIGFNPEFTNQIFGEEEEIYGYEDLKININFLSAQFFANIDFSYTKKYDDADDLYEIFDNVFRGGYYKDKNEFQKLFPDEKNFKPFGKLIKNIKTKDADYEIFYCDLSVEGFSAYNIRLQVFLLFFINGASFIDQDENWKIYLFYKKHKDTYSLVGFTTVYTFFQNIDTCRYRISQFIIFPPYQRKGLGMHLISEVYHDALNDKRCFEITVEDSSIGFQFLRDCKDFELLMNEKCFNWVDQIKDNFNAMIYSESKKSIGKEIIKELIKKYKLTKNQLKRVIEIMKYIHLKPNDEAFSFFKKDVKERLKQANKSEFYPFINKKIPYVAFDGYQAIINPSIYKNSNDNEVETKLEEYFEEIISQYEEIKPKILKIAEMRNKKEV